MMVVTQETIWTRFLRLSRFSNAWVDKVLYFSLFISYFQLITYTLRLSYEYVQLYHTWISDVFRVTEDIMSLDIFNYTSSPKNLLVSCLCVLFYFIILIACFLMTIYQSFRNSQSNLFLSKVWSVLIQIHPNLLFLPINNISLYVQAQSKKEALYDSSETFDNHMAYYISIAVLTINTLFASLPYGFLFDILPNDDSLSSKSFLTDHITLSQKLLVPLFAKVLPEVSFAPWFILSLNCALSFAKYIIYLYILPKYHYKTLAPELYLINFCCVCSGLTLTTFIMKQANSDKAIIDFEGTLIINLVLCPLSVMRSRDILFRVLTNIMVTHYTKLNAYQALHKVSTLKYIEKNMKIPTKFQNRFDISYYYLSIIYCCTKDVFCQRYNGKSFDLNNKSEKNQLKREFLESLVKYFTECEMLRLVLTQFYIKSLHCYLMAVKTLTQKEFNSFAARISAHLLYYQIQQKIREQSNIEIEGLRPTKYIIMGRQIDALKENMRKQWEYQNNFWKEYIANKPDVYKLQIYSKGNCIQSELVSKKWNIMAQNSNNKPPGYLFLLYAHYELLLNDSLLKAEEIIEKYNHLRGWKREDHNNRRGTTRDDEFYDYEDNFSLTIRTDPDKMGAITDCSKSIEKALGHERNDIIGSNIGIIMSPLIADRHNTFIQDYVKTGQPSFTGSLQSVFVKNRSGFLQKCSVLANIHPYVNKEIYLTGLFRLDNIHYDYMLITPSGEIDSCTETIASVLAIAHKKVQINSICPNLMKNHEVPDLNQSKKAANLRENSLDHHESDPLSENLLYSTQRLVRSNKIQSNYYTAKKSIKRRSIIESPLSGFNNEGQGNISGLNFPDELQLEFAPLSSESKSFILYNCKVSKVLVKDTFLLVLELRLIDRNRERGNSRIQNQKEYNIYYNEEPEEKLVNQQEVNLKLLAPDFLLNTESKPILHKSKDNQTNINVTKTDISAFKDVNTTPRPLIISRQNPEERIINRRQQRVVSRTSSSSGSLSTTEKTIQSKIENVTKVDYSSQKARVLLLGFLMIFILIITVQIHLWVSTSSSLKNVTALTTTLDLANSRADTFAYLDRYTMACKFIEKGLIDHKSPIAYLLLQGYAPLCATMVPALKTSNYKLMEAVRDIDASFQGYFKAENIRIYDINPDLTRGSYQKFDTFTAINLLIQKYFKLSGSISDGSFLGSPDLAYILTNSMNDLLLETVNAVEIIFKEAELSIDNSLKTHSSYKVFYLILVILLLGLVIYSSFWTYNSEITLAKYCLGFSNEGVQLVRDRLARFEETLEIQDANELCDSYQSNRYHYKKTEITREKSKTAKYSKSLRTKKVQSQYFKKVAIFFLLLMVYGTMVFFAFEDIIARIQSLGVRMKRLAKIQFISYENSIIDLTLEKIAIQDSDSLVRNRPAEEELGLSLGNFFNGISDLLSLFKDEDGNIDPKVSPIFLEDACNYANISSKSCLDIKKDSKVFGLVSILSRQHSISKDIFEAFNSSNKSVTFQRKMALDISTTLGPNSYVLRELLGTITELARNDYSAQSETTTCALGWSIGIGLVLSCAMCLAIWRFVLSFHIQFLKRFKRKLKLIPIYLLLQDPVLKGILINLSRGKLII